MIDKNMFKSKLFLLFLIFFVGFIFLFMNTNRLEALENNEVELDFSIVDNPWSLSNKINFTLPSEVENKLYHINVNSSNNELIVWIYDSPCSVDGANLTSANQNFYLKIYHYNSSSQKFEYDHDWTHYNKTSVEKFNLIYSNYTMKEKTKFPNWTYAYNSAKDYLASDPTYKSNLEYFIGKLKKSGYSFIISIDDKGGIYPILSQNKKEFLLDFANNDLRYSTPVASLNVAWGVLEHDNYTIEMLTKDYVDKYIKDVNKNFDKLYFSTLASPFSGGGLDNNIVLYSSFSKTITLKNYLPPVFVNDVPFVGSVPTFDNLNNFFLINENDEIYDYPDFPTFDTEGGEVGGEESWDTADSDKTQNAIKKWIKSIFDGFPIFKQIDNIKDKWTWSEGADCLYHNIDAGVTLWKCYLVPNLEFTIFDHKYDLNGFDVTWFLKYRDLIHFWICLSVGMFTALKCFKIAQTMFHGK